MLLKNVRTNRLSSKVSRTTSNGNRNLGFALPQILRDLYLRVANGGFGPGTGLRRVEGGYKGAYHQSNDLPSAQGYSHLLSYTTYEASAVHTEAEGGVPLCVSPMING